LYNILLPAIENLLNKKLTEITEEELLSALKNKKRDAVGILYDKYSSFLFGLINRIVHSDEIAEDILQEVFVKIWKNIDSYDSKKAKLVTWMANIARNLAIDKIRSKEYKNQLQNQDIGDYVNVIEDSSSSGFNPEHIGVKEMLKKLQPEQRILVDLVYFQGFTQADAAEKLGIPLGTVKTRIRSAINILREFFT
jgi:RNA polymerase sigma-70 factor (ECF subfamily)